MEIIDFKDIGFNRLKKTSRQGLNSIMLIDENRAYKILLDTFSKDEIYKKLKEMEGIKIDGMIMPKEYICKNGMFIGYSMDYVKNSVSIYDKFSGQRYMSMKELLEILKKASTILKNIHSEGIIYQDLSFDNILVDDKNNINFIDIDSCAYKNYYTNFAPNLLLNFIDYLGYDYSQIISMGADRLSFLLGFYYISYFKEIEKLNISEYKYLYDNVKTICMANSVVKKIYEKYSLEEVPYFDELIDINDDFIIDRNMQIDFSRSLKMDYSLN